MSEDKIMRHVPNLSIKKKTLQTNNNGTQKTRNAMNKSADTKGNTIEDSGNGKENLDDRNCVEPKEMDSNEANSRSHSKDGEILTDLDSITPINGQHCVNVQHKRNRFTKQQSEASSSNATRDNNAMNESKIKS